MTSVAARKADDDQPALPPPHEDAYNTQAEQELLARILELAYLGILRATHELLSTALADIIDPEHFRLDDAATRRVLQEAANRVVRIDATTRQAIREQLQVGQERGYSSWQLAHGVPVDGYDGIDGLFKERWRSRAETVSRTELQHAQLVSARDRYIASGVVSQMQIHDGHYDDACAARDGRIVPIQEQVDLLHPNCVVYVTPILAPGIAPQQ